MIKLYPKFESKEVYRELNKIINKLIGPMTEDCSFENEYAFQFEEYENLLFNHLNEKTNLEKELNNRKASLKSIRINLLEILCKLKKLDKNIDYNDLLKCLNNEIKAIQERKIKNYTFIFLSNIERPCCLRFKDIKIEHKEFKDTIDREIEVNNFFESIFKLFYIKRLNTEKYLLKANNASKIEKIIGISNSYNGEVFEVNIRGRDEDFAIKKASFKLNAFLGFLSFIFNSFGTQFKYNTNEDFRLFEIKPKHVFVIENYNEVNNFHWEYILYEEKRIKRELGIMDLKSLKISENTEKFESYCKVISKIKNKSLLDLLYGAFSLYYSATSEKSLNYSSIKFWVFSEYLIKKSGGKSDDQILKIMEKIFKLYEHNEFLSKRIDFLHKKRNHLVHQDLTIKISQEDRNLSKLISDYILHFYMHSVFILELKNINEFDFLITNIGKEENELERHLKILKSFKKARFPDGH